jgi:hypothetical protein
MRCGPTHLVLIIGLATAGSASAQIAVTSPTMIERTMLPGEMYRDTITIHNSSKTIQAVSLSLADYRFDASGATEFDPPATQPRSNVPWIALSQKTVSVLPHGDIAVSYAVKVPESAPQPHGTYWSVVLVQAARSSAPAESGFSVVPTMQYAIQVATHVGRSGEARLAFGEPHLVRTGLTVAVDPAARLRDESWALGSDAMLAIDVTHSGTRACRPAVRLEIYQPDGRLAHSATSQRGLLYPGSSIRQVFKLPPLAPGDYVVLLLADVGTDKVQGTKFQLHVP